MARLKDQPQRFSFDAAVRVLTFLRRRADPAAAARFTSTTGSSYLPAEVTQVQVDAGIAEPLVTVGLIGLTGPVGVLPRYYSDAVVADQRSRAFSLTRFPRPDFASHGRGLRRRRHEIPAASRRRCRRAGGRARERGDPVAEVLLSLDRLRHPSPRRTPARGTGGAAPLRGLFLRSSALRGSARSAGLRLAGPAGQGRTVRRRLAGAARRSAVAPRRSACRPADFAS